MKSLFRLHKLFFALRFITILIAGIFNMYGIYLMAQSHPKWSMYVKISIAVLFVVVLFSFFADLFKKKIFNKATKIFLKEVGLEDAEIIKKTEDRQLLKKDGNYYTLEYGINKNDVAFILNPAYVSWEGYVVLEDETVDKRSLNFMLGWELPDWDKDNTKTNEENKEKEDFNKDEEQNSVEE